MDFLLERFAGAPDAVAFIDRDRRVTYREVLEATAAFGERLAREGVATGDVVVIYGDYSPELFCLLLALAKNRNVIVPVTRDSVIEKDRILQTSRARWVVDFGAEVSFSRAPAPALPPSPLLDGLVAAGDPGLILFTSGSSGAPKAILHDLSLVADKFRRQGPRIVAIAFLMLDHFGGINTILAITSGLGTVVTVPDRSVRTICETIERHRVEVLPATPSFLNLLIRSGAPERHDLSSLRRITYGTEVMHEETLARVRRAFPAAQLQQTYGLSELGVLRSKSREDGSLWVRIGGDGFETRIVDGRLWIRSRYAMLGYLDAPSPFDADGWFDTEDRVEVDGEWLRILGRETDLINVAGQKVYPAEVEQAILELDNIVDVAVYGEKSALVGQAVAAKVVTREPEPAADLKQRIRKACGKKLAAFKLPTKVLVVDAAELYSLRFKKRRQA